MACRLWARARCKVARGGLLVHSLEGSRCVLFMFIQLMQVGFFLAYTLSWAGGEWDKKRRSVHGLVSVYGTCMRDV